MCSVQALQPRGSSPHIRRTNVTLMPFDARPRPRYLAIINRGAGTVRSRGAELVRDLVEQGLKETGEADVRLVEGREIAGIVAEALAAKSADIIVVGGGDGTIASVAGQLAGSDIALAVLPLGTMNMVSQAAGFTQTLEDAIHEIAVGEAQAVDVGRVNGRAFLHQVSFGIQPRVVRIREKIAIRRGPPRSSAARWRW